ncbi:MAG TPA: FG-GAP-like repeat-containing protein [Candidatus Polarisedimenticolaceae bacterium]|nr:FG-GAP-like repeat-containing protein [Candidatus Polarisedimenticolaceae bacterium]
MIAWRWWAVPVLALACGACHRARGVPESVVEHNTRGTAYLGQQKWADAEREFRAALTERPRDAVLSNNLGVALKQQGKFDDAAAAFQEALRAAPADPYAHYNLGLLAKNRGEFAQAVTHLEAVASVDPADALTQYHLGVVYARVEREADAERAFRRVLSANPSHVSTLYGLGRLLLQQGHNEEGERLVQRSQQVRARSGLEEAVGTQYGEEGPYALGVDYPGGGLAAPAPLGVTFRSAATAAASSPRPASALTRLAEGRSAVCFGAAASVTCLPGNSVQQIPQGLPLLALAAGDVDNDGSVELLALLGGARPALRFLAGAGGTFAPSAELPADTPPLGADLVFVDRDHDGDLDLLVCWSGPTRCALGTNDGKGGFTLRPSPEHGFEFPAAPAGRVQLAFSDADNDRDIDLLVLEPGGVHLLANQRDGTFTASSEDSLGASLAGAEALVVADLDKDGWMDLVVAGREGLRLVRNRRGRFDPPAPLGSERAAATSVVVLDYDDDGFLDLACSSPRGPRLLRNRGAGEWAEASEPLSALQLSADTLPLAALDADGDGDPDLLVAGGGRVALLANDGGNAHRWLAVDSHGVADNRYGVGSKVEVLSGALRQKFELTNPCPLLAGLGNRERAQSVRHLWPSGVLQDEVDRAAGGVAEVTELDRKGTSCPLLYAWRGGGWQFVSDFLGGCAIGYQHAPGVLNVPDTDEYVRIEGGIEPDGDGQLRVRLNNQLEEVIWFDQAELVAVDHPQGTQVYPNERLMPGPPWPRFQLFASDRIRPLAAARSVEDGRDLGAVLGEADRRYADGFPLLGFKGYAAPHALELDLGAFPPGERVVLLLDGWIDYADSTSNIAAHQAGLELNPPRLAVADGHGGWREVEGLMGFPAGLPKTIAVELTGRFPSSDHRLRLTTNMRIYWDRGRVMLGGGNVELHVRRLAPRAAELRFGGFPRETSPDGRKPFAYDPLDVSAATPWKTHRGAYTPFGDVTERLARVDDRFVTTRNGDEIELRFAAPAPPAPGWTRTYLLYADGFGKDMDLNSLAADEVGPIPFHGMPLYPYGPEVVPPTVPEAGGRRVLR